jgi:HEPN domain-containing protein
MENLSILDHKAWLVKADHDIKGAKVCLREDDLFDLVVYHAQQTAEKALKAFLVFHTKQVIKKHDLIFLTDRCVIIDFSFIQLLTHASDLNFYSTYSRYPDDYFTFDLAEASAACKKATFILEFVKDRLPK